MSEIKNSWFVRREALQITEGILNYVITAIITATKATVTTTTTTAIHCISFNILFQQQ